MFWKSNGIVRFLGFGITFFGEFVAPHIPVVAAFSPGIREIGLLVTGLGTANAVMK